MRQDLEAQGTAISPRALTAALERIASAAAGALELREVFAAVAEAASAILPFDRVSLMRLEGVGLLRLYTRAGPLPPPSARTEVALEDFSPAIRPSPRTCGRVADLGPVLDPAYLVDRWWAEQGLRAALWAPIFRGGQPGGFLYLTSRTAGAFTAGHEAALASIAAVVGLAIEHKRLWSLDLARRRRLEAVDELLPTLATALDVRAIFDRVSERVQPLLRHDRLVLASRAADGQVVTVDALWGEPLSGSTTVDLGADAARLELTHEVVRDFEEEPDGPRSRLSRVERMRSGLSVRLWADGTGAAALVFLSHAPGQYSDEDVPVAQKVAAYVSLALSHQRLAEEQRRAGEARERASRLEARVERLKEELERSRGHRRIVGVSARWGAVLARAAKVAAAETTVLLTGESGTGKEVVARFIHRGSPRAEGPFIALNCGALPETLLESELFGHERGAFTGAVSARAGRIQQADGGVLFLDEVGETPPALQVKLLRVLQEREYQRLGGSRPLRANVRIVAATNRDLTAALARGQFREDLYYRLRVFEIDLPPLRERPEDVLPLARAFLEEIAAGVARPAEGISSEAAACLLAYAWPGNVRELRNVLERATILCDGGLITADHLPDELALRGRPRRPARDDAGLDLGNAEREVIVRALAAARDNRTHAARLLGLTRPQLYRRLRKHGLAVHLRPQ